MKKIYLAMHTFDGKCEVLTTKSLINNIISLTKCGYDVLFDDDVCCYLGESRSALANRFLKSDCDEMIFIDADLGFQNDAIVKIAQFDKDLVCGSYPYKTSTPGYPVSVISDPTFSYHTPLVEIQSNGDPLIKAQIAPTGMMKIKRCVFEKMIEEHPEWKTTCKTHGDRYLFFETGRLIDGSNCSYGEDVLFCHRWREMGGDVWIYPDIDFTHIGKIGYTGNYHKFLLQMPRP